MVYFLNFGTGLWRRKRRTQTEGEVRIVIIDQTLIWKLRAQLHVQSVHTYTTYTTVDYIHVNVMRAN